MSSNIKNIEFDTELSPGAYNAINVCLRLKPEERITLVTDEESIEIAASLVNEIEKTGSKYRLFLLEDIANRPLKRMPEIILNDLPKSQASILAVVTQPNELQSRIQMLSLINKNKIRHGHMVNISKQIMLEGMRADFLEVDDLSRKLVEKARKAKEIRAVSGGGTNIKAEFSPNLKWIKTSGIISPDEWGNLPGGEIFTAPFNLNGRFVVDGVVGDYLCQRYGDLKEFPLTIEIVNNKIKELHCENQELLNEFTAYTMSDENSSRVGEFAIGTNTAVKNIIGQILQDEKLPGVHIAFGNPAPEHTGADWTSSTHIDCVGRGFDIWMDEDKVMENGKFLI
ncbi:MAG TPA: aminopeptidase [Ignavibacteriaceae bacterium]|nr:aminopeptidase [Ignavibacteriaceae bacterium]